MNETKVYCYRQQFSVAADKPTRAQSIRARAAMGKVYLPRNAPWVADLLHEILTFPSGKNDDQVDALGLFGRVLDRAIGGKHPPSPIIPDNGIGTYNQMMAEYKREKAKEEIYY
jgi:alkylation response protein AidB-like acyl-CoA dehydrogenase